MMGQARDADSRAVVAPLAGEHPESAPELHPCDSQARKALPRAAALIDQERT